MISSIAHKRQASIQRRAFTLIEMAIVLGIIGIVLAAVWMVAGTVWNNHKMFRAQQQIMTVVRNIRDFYGLSGKPLATLNANVACQNNLVPNDMIQAFPCNDNSLRHALGGRFQFLAGTPPASAFRLSFQNLSQQNCVKMLMNFPVLSPEIGVSRIAMQGGPSIAVNLSDISNVDPNLPFTQVTARIWCADAVNNANEVDIDFRVRN